MTAPVVLFVCVHNAGRSQIAAALLTHRSGGAIEVRSGGSAPGESINPAVPVVMAELGIDVSHAFPKKVTDGAVREADVVITMGCGDACPVYPGKSYEDWQLEDPAGQDVSSVRRIRDEIDARVQDLIARLAAKASAKAPAKAADMTESQMIQLEVKKRYAELAVLASTSSVSCCSEGETCFGTSGYQGADLSFLPAEAINASLGCGNPTALAELQPGEVVLDLGSGGGIDVLLSARRVAPGGRAIGLDMTGEMLDLARRNAAESGISNVEFLKGHIEQIPLPDASVDVVISNCVINLSTDKARVLGEVARVLKPGGRLAVSDVVADPDIDDATRQDMQLWTGCIAGALTEQDYRRLLSEAGLAGVEVSYTSRVHPHAGSAFVRAVRPVDELSVNRR
ncbi:MAG: arsenite methyltransferase [Actinomycetota bacterium]